MRAHVGFSWGWGPEGPCGRTSSPPTTSLVVCHRTGLVLRTRARKVLYFPPSLRGVYFPWLCALVWLFLLRGRRNCRVQHRTSLPGTAPLLPIVWRSAEESRWYLRGGKPAKFPAGSSGGGATAKAELCDQESQSGQLREGGAIARRAWGSRGLEIDLDEWD